MSGLCPADVTRASVKTDRTPVSQRDPNHQKRRAAVFDKTVDDGIKRRAGGAGGLGSPWGEDVLDDSEGCGARTFGK